MQSGVTSGMRRQHRAFVRLYGKFDQRAHRLLVSSSGSRRITSGPGSLLDLHDLAVRQVDESGFQLTMEELRKTHAAKGAFLRRLAKANL